MRVCPAVLSFCLCLSLCACQSQAAQAASSPPVPSAALEAATPPPTQTPAPITGASWAVSALETLEARTLWLPDAARDAAAGVDGSDFSRLCAIISGMPQAEFDALAVAGPLDRKTAAVTATHAVMGRRLRLLDLSDRESVPESAREGVETAYRYGLMSGVDGAFLPERTLTWGEAAALLNRLADLPERTPAPSAEVNFAGFAAGESLLSEGQKQALRDYFDLHHAAMAGLTPTDMAPVFASEAGRAVELENTILSCFITERRYSPIDLTMSAYSYALSVLGVSKQSDGGVRVYLGEYGAMAFRGTGGALSEEPLVHHTFFLVPVGGGWKVRVHSRDDSGFTRFEDTADRPAEGRAYLAEARENLLLRESQGGGLDTAKSCDHPLDRAAAVSYANAHADTRNPNYADYTSRGGNCQNYVSQCLAAGGAQLDNSGDQQWNTGAASWISVSNFRRYLQNNTGAGLVARLDAPYDTGEPGDVIQMGFVNTGKHAMLVTGLITDETGATVDYYICSNTCNWRNMPMSAHWYTDQTLIKVYGWND